MDCKNTDIISLDVSNNTNLKILSCRNNAKLETLKVDGASALVLLNCYGTGITGLDVSKNNNLSSLDCNNTSLAYLNLGTKTKISFFIPTTVTMDLDVTEDTFNIKEKISGIDSSKVSITSGADYDSATGIVSNYTGKEPIIYTYDCGTADNVQQTLEVTLNHTGYSAGIELNDKNFPDEAFRKYLK